MHLNDAQAVVHFEKVGHGFSVGMVIVEPYGLRSYLCEIDSYSEHPFASIDQSLHLLFVFGVKRVILNAKDLRIIEEIKKNYEGFEVKVTHNSFFEEEQNALYLKYLPLNSLLSPLEHLNLEDRPLSAQALSTWCIENQESETTLFTLPKVLMSDEWMELGNNALEQLEIVGLDQKNLNIAKVFLVMQTPMGMRLGRMRLFLPIQNQLELENRYEWVESVSAHLEWFRQQLTHIGNLDLLWLNFKLYKEENYLLQLMVLLEKIDEIYLYVRKHQIHKLLWNEYNHDWIYELKNNKSNKDWVQANEEYMEQLSLWIAKVDVAVASSWSAKQYGLTKPTLVQRKKESFLQMLSIRHLLIELQGISYVPNDIVMGDRDFLDLPYPKTVMLDPHVHDGANIRGVLLYGINSSGKSSLMKAVGISVVLAQAGFFVPVKAMKFTLFDGIYTRIQSRDNISKSLSTFGVEMLELNSIFTRASEKSLILGDEISHGTETLSAVSIVASTILELNQKKSFFLMTTHLHQLSMVKELSKLRNVVNLHLSVEYNENKDELEYDRILKGGRGSSVYGLEFAESLHMNTSFLKNAKQLRENLAKEYDVLELGHQKEYIKRYRETVACECSVCGTLVRKKEVLGIKNDSMLPLCDKHFRELSEGKIKLTNFIMTPNGLRLEFEKQLQG